MPMKCVEIDKKKLERALRVRGLTNEDASNRIYCNKNFFAKVLSNTSKSGVSPQTLDKMRDLLDITYDDIKPDPQEPDQPKEPEVTQDADGIDYPKLQIYIYRAVSSAIESQMAEVLKNIFIKDGSDFAKVIGRAVYVGTREALRSDCRNGKENGND